MEGRTRRKAAWAGSVAGMTGIAEAEAAHKVAVRRVAGGVVVRTAVVRRIVGEAAVAARHKLLAAVEDSIGREEVQHRRAGVKELRRVAEGHHSPEEAEVAVRNPEAAVVVVVHSPGEAAGSIGPGPVAGHRTAGEGVAAGSIPLAAEGVLI